MTFSQEKTDQRISELSPPPDASNRVVLEPSHDFRQYLWAHREDDIARARVILRALPAETVVRVVRYLVESYWARYLGWPDLFIFKEGEFRFAEVKFSKDKLSDEQRRWIALARRTLDLPFSLVKIHRTAEGA